jgi:hypothetical protein
VLGFGIRKQIDEDTEVLGYTAVTTYIDSTIRRKYMEIRPDWRESFLRITGRWGSFTAGRTLGLYSRGATEITYLYGFRYGLGWPGDISSTQGSGTTAGLVGFGILGNGFAAGLTYATPVLAGTQLTVGLYDANSLVGSATWERVKWPRAEAEATFEQKLHGVGMFKLFGNGAWQKIYSKETPSSATIAGVGYGGRLEVGPVHLGLAGHYGEGIGIDYALQPSDALYDKRDAFRDNFKLRAVSGYSAHLMVTASQLLDVSAAAGVTRVIQNPEDRQDWTDDDKNPATNPCCDASAKSGVDSVGFVTLKQQVGMFLGATIHATENIHVALEYLRIKFEWYKPTPALPTTTNPTQSFNIINAGITYTW